MNNNLMCPQCGNPNDSNTRFCVRCGNNLQSNMVNQTMNMGGNPNPVPQQPMYGNPGQQMGVPMQQQGYNNAPMNMQRAYAATGNFNFFEYIFCSVLKPFDRFKKEEQNLSSFKNSGILTLIVVGAMVIINLIQTMFNAVRVTSFWTGEVTWNWENLKNIEYFKVLGQSLLTYAGVIFAISGIYFLASLVIKKDAKFPKLLGATVTAYLPFALVSSIASPLLSLIYVPLGICVTVVSAVYSLIILLELINELVKIENKNSRIYFHMTCLSILVLSGGFIAYKILLSSLTSSLGGLLG